MSELLGRIQGLWDGLAPRERLLVGIAGAAVAIMILFFGVVMPVMAAAENATATAENAEQQLAMMQRMRLDWDGLHGRLSAVETQIESNRDGQNLRALGAVSRSVGFTM